MAQVQIPIQPVDDPILCPPYEEPSRHWLYDTRTGVPSKNPGRRPASYWYKSERAGSAQRSLFAEEERDDLPLVNALREDVRRWRKAGWPSTSGDHGRRGAGGQTRGGNTRGVRTQAPGRSLG